jgi:SAM-dependent methyltransferase
MSMDSRDWDARYAAVDLVWSADPNQWVEELVTPLTAGRALDVAAGEGRNAIWLVEQGWEAVAADYSEVAVERARALGDERLGDRAGRLTTVVADATEPAHGGPAAYDLVLFSYLQLPMQEWRKALASGIEAAAPGGRVIVIAHALSNLTAGWGGPQDPAVLYDPEDVVAVVKGLPDLPVDVELAELRTRHVTKDDGEHDALDTVVVLRRR